MVCLYCRQNTQVVNSRHQSRSNSVWRRRKCVSCGSIFSTTEVIDLSRSISVESDKRLEPFSRDKLLMSIFTSCGHRKDATRSATALTDTVIGKMLTKNTGPLLQRDRISEITYETLKRFDRAAAVQYQAYHPVRAK